MSKEKVIIVNEKDEIIGHKERSERTKEDIYRVSALWITNSKGDILIAQRKFTKKHSPGQWGAAVAGTNDFGETYTSNIIKESEEEIGITGFKFTKADKSRHYGKFNYFCQWFTVIIDKEIEFFTIQEEEVEQIKWITREELSSEIKLNPDKYLDSTKERLEIFK